MPQTPRHDRGTMNSNHSGSNKKRYGRNNHDNNKFSKAVPPPLSSDKADRNANNGLLLLSTKKTSSSMLASKNATISSGAGANVNLHQASSTHQALLSAVTGTQDVGPQQKPDAWGTIENGRKEKSKNETSKHQNERVDCENHGTKEIQQQESPENEASWDEYGGRGRSGSASEVNITGGQVDDEMAYMSRLAKERASTKSYEEGARAMEQKSKTAQRLQEVERKRNGRGHETKDRSKGGRTLWDPDSQRSGKEYHPQNRKASSESLEGDETIQLNSYDDRNRGDPGPAAAPRMLYDPKSGSMVEVKGKVEKSGNGNNGKSRKERNRPKNKKEKEAKPQIVLKKGRNNQKGKKDLLLAKKSNPPEKKRANPNRKHPRTCGVQYKRVGKGNLQSADSCDGDLGYGAHSIPGGKVQNSEAYNSWYNKDASYDENNAYGLEGLEGALDYGLGGEFNYSEDQAFGELDENTQPTLEWIKADDKLELVTGVDDSPTLKPTAKEFAPSQIPLSAAASGNDSSDDISATHGVDVQDEEESEGEEGGSEDHAEGLGFDPLQGIDFMNSPPNHDKTPDEIATAGLSSLTLAPTMFSDAQTEDPSTTISRPFFSFGTSDTWGQSSNAEQASTVGLNGWGSEPISAGLFGSDMFGRAKEQETDSVAFLGGGAGNSWSQSGIPGLDTLAAFGADQGSAPAD